MADKCPSRREMFIRRRLSFLILVALVILGGYQAWRITDLQQLRNQAIQERIDEAARAEYIVNSAPVAMIMCDENGDITSFNPAAEQIFGYSAKDVRGQPIHMLVGTEYSTSHIAAFHAAVDRLQQASGNWQISCRVQGPARRKGGQEFMAVIAVRGIKYSGHVEFLAIVQPVTQEYPELSRLNPTEQKPPPDEKKQTAK